MKLSELLTKADAKAQTKLGFIAEPVLASIGLGGLPAWLVSRAIAAVVCAALVLGYLEKRDHDTAQRVGREYVEKAERQRKDHEKALGEIAAAAERDRETIEGAWKRTLKGMADRNRELEAALQAAPKQPSADVCYSKPVLKALKQKAIEANKRYLK